MSVFFPKITTMVVNGFDKIFASDNFKVELFGDLNILLGGNGLGKTTLLQCLVYALTGGTDDIEAEEMRGQRWNHTFFKGRVNDNAYVTVDFQLGEKLICIKRGFTSSRVLNCSASSLDKDDCKIVAFEQAIIEYGNYNSTNDFSFIVNRLLYLSENRRSLLWDYDAQVRALMIINNEFIIESEYRKLRQLIKKKDSNKRKIRWDIGRIEKRSHLLTSGDKPGKKPSSAQNDFIKNKRLLLVNLQNETENSKRLYSLIKEKVETRNSLAQTISSIGNQIRKTEAEYVQALLLEHDEKNALIYNKTLKTGYCPACDQKSDPLKSVIQERVRNRACLVCGELISSNKNQPICTDLEALNSQLAEKVSARNELDVQIGHNKNKLSQAEEEILTIRNQLSKLDYDYTDDFLTTDDDADELDFIDEEQVAQDLVNLCQKEKELEAEINQLTMKADDIYASFLANFQTRFDQLQQVYADLASKFIGTHVKLTYTKSKAKFVNMKYLTPCFNGVSRGSPETCSEAQRFFLDIAFRMSIISLYNTICNAEASFICETPENALDVSYIDNVVKMFLSFMQRGGNLIITSNLQYLGIAQSLIKHSKTNNLSIGVFDLLNYGRLSDIQTSSTQLTEIRDAILEEVEL